ncbi:MAG TPA: hypothetical protein VJW51_11715 [Candidatus Acidoferrales bacterium]|nr:hypothetical protein [Candidatus Acidoferrales bacterium]
MSEKKPKRFQDLPQFLVQEVRHDTPFPGQIELVGKLDAAARVEEGQCWLVWPSAEGVLGELTFQVGGDHLAMFRAHGELPSDPLGTKLAHLRDRWKLYHLWMAFSPVDIWNHAQFAASDAEARAYGTDGHSLAGQSQPDKGMQLRKIGSQTGRSRCYPEPPGGFPPDHPMHGNPAIVKAGWDHEHCEYCWKHIEQPQWAYVNPDDDWVCESCFNKYVANHDLSFVDEL